MLIQWKREAEEVTRGMTAAQLIEFYRLQAEDVERRLGLHLTVSKPDDATRPRRN
jgi:hypothetical protein